MYMDLSPALREFKPGLIMMYPQYFLGIVFEKIGHSCLEILLDYDGIVIHRPDLFRDTLERDWRISCDLSSIIQ
jgi:hypothetical protein